MQSHTSSCLPHILNCSNPLLLSFSSPWSLLSGNNYLCLLFCCHLSQSCNCVLFHLSSSSPQFMCCRNLLLLSWSSSSSLCCINKIVLALQRPITIASPCLAAALFSPCAARTIWTRAAALPISCALAIASVFCSCAAAIPRSCSTLAVAGPTTCYWWLTAVTSFCGSAIPGSNRHPDTSWPPEGLHFHSQLHLLCTFCRTLWRNLEQG